jgi:hypothetical protein
MLPTQLCRQQKQVSPLGKQRLDWESLKLDFMKNQYANLKEFAEAKGISHGTIRNRCSGWMAEKANYKERVTDLAVSGTLALDVMTVTERNLYHVEVWDKFLAMVVRSFDNEYTLCNADGTVRVGMLERLANTMEKIQKCQRLALGMDKETKDNKGLFAEFAAAINAARSGCDTDGSTVQPETD